MTARAKNVIVYLLFAELLNSKIIGAMMAHNTIELCDNFDFEDKSSASDKESNKSQFITPSKSGRENLPHFIYAMCSFRNTRM